MTYPKGVFCDRARAWAALAPDGELSELERKLLGSHLDRCDACASFAVHVAAVAVELRASSLEPLPRPVSTAVCRRRGYGGVRAAGAAAAVALMAFGVGARAPISPDDGRTLGFPRVTNFADNAEREVALIIRRSENDNERSRFRPTVEGVTRPI